MSDRSLLIREPDQVWTVHAFHPRKGIVPMTKTFGLIGDGDTVHERIEVKKHSDPAWASQWKGWLMIPVWVSAGVKI